ncbi:hypothetical protein BASA81_006618 [Batrachochytrium salamandrivorans]|nr:hypothetical protein BASA81_006618 [Batrachochytrium salamandrivorans]
MTKLYQCPECRKSFKYPKTYEVHFRQHSGEKPYACEQCTSPFSQNSHLKRHMLVVHGKVRPFACEQCGKKFSERSALTNHARVHLDRQLGCEQCGRMFATPQALETHRRLHQEPRPLVPCPDCPSLFTQQVNMNRHRKRFHELSEMTLAQSPIVPPTTAATAVDSKTAPAAIYELHARRKPYICVECGMSNKIIRRRLLSTVVADLRSDTVALPTQAVRDLMAQAPMGDDVYREDTSCLLLEQQAAKMLGKEDSVFLTSGTMGNLAAFMSHCDTRGSEVIAGSLQHTYLYEQGGSAALAGIHTRVVPNLPDGTLPISDVLRAIQTNDQHFAQTKLVSVENTHNMCGGVPLPVEYLAKLKSALAPHVGVKLHMDGARVCNAAVALQVPLTTICQHVDSLSLCLSKGLGAPVGSLVAGDHAFCHKVRRAKKALGGGWRKAGGLASAGLYVLERYPDTLARDHKLAKLFARELELIGITVPQQPQTNMVFFQAPQWGEMDIGKFTNQAKQLGVLFGSGYGTQGNLVRAVIHQNIAQSQLDQAVQVLRKLAAN